MFYFSINVLWRAVFDEIFQSLAEECRRFGVVCLLVQSHADVMGSGLCVKQRIMS